MARHFRIHPAIGAARMGNSSDGFFVGPETPGVPANLDANGNFKSFRDAQGRVLRQAARFRIFEYDEDTSGSLINPREVQIGTDFSEIEWRVHLANRKASFFTFNGQDGAEDLYLHRQNEVPQTERRKEEPDRTNLRNSHITGDRSGQLDIDPGEKRISTSDPADVELSNPNPNIPIVSLGTLKLDGAKLVVLGGRGESNSSPAHATIDEYASNDHWFDDAGDGSVNARITLATGETVEADSAWVMVGPPKFAPAHGNVVRLFDTLWDTAVRDVALTPGTPTTPLLVELRKQKAIWLANGAASLNGYQPSFTKDIQPLLKRALGARDVHVSGLTNSSYHLQLRDWEILNVRTGPNATRGKQLRDYVFNWMRDPASNDVQWEKMPRGNGDDYTALDEGHPLPTSFLSLTRIQYAMLKEWAAGNFVADWPGAEPLFTASPNPTPDELDLAAAENCVGGPFYPGIEVSWLIRVPDLFAEPLRLKSPATGLKVGALDFRPGFFSQQMAVPWQADFYDCRKEPHDGPDDTQYWYMWWSAQRPDDVFPSGAASQARWVRAFDGNLLPEDADNIDRFERFNLMQQRWHELKFITVKKDDHYEEEP